MTRVVDFILQESGKDDMPLVVGKNVDCEVTEHRPFGVMVWIPELRMTGIIERIRMEQDGFTAPDDYPRVGSRISAKILGVRDWSKQVELALDLRRNSKSELLEVGLRMSGAGKLEFFGIDEVNQKIADGFQVEAIEKGRALMKKSGETEETVKLRFEGFSIAVLLKKPPATSP